MPQSKSDQPETQLQQSAILDQTQDTAREQSQPAQEQTSAFQPAQLTQKKSNLPLILIIILFLTFVGSAAAHYMGFISLEQFKQFYSKEEQAAPTQEAPTVDTTIQSLPTDTQLFTGKVQKLDQDLELFRVVEDGMGYNENTLKLYYSAGVFTSSPLEGYTRIIAVRDPDGPGPILTYTLATHDFETFILDDPLDLTNIYDDDDWSSPYKYLDKTKISSAQTFLTYHDQVIELDNTFALNRKDYLTAHVKTGLTSDGYDLYQPELVTSFAKYQALTSPHESLKFLFKPYEVFVSTEPGIPDKYVQQQQLKNQYFAGETSVIVVDSTGLAIVYSLTTKPAIGSYHQQSVAYNQEYEEYERLLQQFHNNEIEEYPAYPERVEKPSLGFPGTQIQTTQNLQWFDTYHAAYPGACGLDLDTTIIKVDQSELEQVGTVYGLPVYRPADPNHDLYRLAYSNKLDYYLEMSEGGYDEFGSMHDGASIPSYEEYLEKNPLLILKDYWQRWVAVGEYDILLPGGCGKPVVYLYPTVPTQVEVRLLKPMQLTTHIPSYHASWRVLAQPSGTLTDLQPELTDCTAINSNQPGLEYARQACETNRYPYLYWSGNVLDSTYPKVDQGWAVSRPQLNEFLATKLDEMGLNSAESSEFLSYWVPQMLAKNANYYRVSFLQTQQLNQFIPMMVNPTPDTVFRIFLDYQPLAQQPEQLPEPQNLQKLHRQGFTLVEWGGLKF